MLLVYGVLWYFDLLAIEKAQFNKWRITMRQHDTNVWAKLTHLYYHAVFKGLCGERVIRHDREDSGALPMSLIRSYPGSTAACRETRTPTPEILVDAPDNEPASGSNANTL